MVDLVLPYPWPYPELELPRGQVDDDSYVRVGPLLARLAALPRQRLLLGWIDADPGGPHRDPAHTWFVSSAEWAPDAYPPWAHGAGYVLSQARPARGRCARVRRGCARSLFLCIFMLLSLGETLRAKLAWSSLWS